MAWADCVITVKGNGVGGYGHTKLDRTKPLREFAVMNCVLFPRVNEHLKACQKCDVAEIVTCYLDRLRNPPTKQVTGGASQALLKQIARLAKIAKKRGTPVPQPLLNELYLRGNEDAVMAAHPMFTHREVAEAYLNNREEPDSPYRGIMALELLPTYKWLFKAIDALGQVPAQDELDALIEVSEVMLG